MKTKDFDSVQMMRDIREKIQERYKNAPEKREADLAVIREKYSHLVRQNPSIGFQKGK